MTRDEFEAGYASRSGLTIDQLRYYGRVVRPCVCEEPECPGWQSVRIHSDDEWPDNSPFPVDDPRYQPAPPSSPK